MFVYICTLHIYHLLHDMQIKFIGQLVVVGFLLPCLFQGLNSVCHSWANIYTC